jgi:hydrogenase maturation protein HypF
MIRRAITITGIVQGVGFRPFTYRLASQLGIQGFIKNCNGGVVIEAEGQPEALDQFLADLTAQPPPLARIDALHWSSRPPRGDHAFRIESSAFDEAGPVFISPDIATCADCLAELFDHNDRRYRYPFLNCTNCGPRLTIVRAAPYDRERTTMAGFAMCPSCRAEYEDPTNRRFHAQPTACPQCGPRLSYRDDTGRPIETPDPISLAADAFGRGRIGAIKGLGGYHLACVARDEKPFALMVEDLAAAHEICEVSPDEEDLLLSPRRPIVLLRRRANICLAEGIAPRNPWLGVMLPYTPLHHLLLRELDRIPLVMTSGNRSDEPIAYEDPDARERLARIADFFLVHDRPIQLRCDDSVTRMVAGVEQPIRRSRGEAPRPISLSIDCRRPTLALGGQLKTTFALGRGRHAFLSHHIGDLDHYEAYRAYVAAIDHYQQLFDLRAEMLVHDLHDDYQSTSYARNHGNGRPTIAVQHHHAHMASCMAEHGLDEPVIGVTFDGSGLGTDGVIWGGEFLTGDYRAFHRSAHLRPVVMPGGEQAIREPWRMAAAHLADAGESLACLSESIPTPARGRIERMIEGRFHAPWTTSMGRLFDAVAALAGVRQRVSFEGQAAMELEWLAWEVGVDGVYPFEIGESASEGPLVIDLRPTIVEVAHAAHNGEAPSAIARRFHSTIVEVVARVCDRLRDRTGLDAVVLSGGVFLNALLTTEAEARLLAEGFRVYRHRLVPPNDGGLSLGQIAVAAAQGGVGEIHKSNNHNIGGFHPPYKQAGRMTEDTADVSGNPGEGRRDVSRARHPDGQG